MALSKRMKAVYDLVPPCACVADIGCDHGYLSAALIENEKADRVIACDISGPSLAKATELAKLRGLWARIETRLGDGLETLRSGEADCAVIAGVGGELTVNILKRHPQIAASAALVLQPMTDAGLVRRYLYANGFAIDDETAVCEGGKCYQALRARYDGVPKPFGTTLEMEIGKLNLERGDAAVRALCRRQCKILRSALGGMGKARSGVAEYESMLKLCEDLKTALCRMEAKNQGGEYDGGAL